MTRHTSDLRTCAQAGLTALVGHVTLCERGAYDDIYAKLTLENFIYVGGIALQLLARALATLSHLAQEHLISVCLLLIFGLLLKGAAGAMPGGVETVSMAAFRVSSAPVAPVTDVAWFNASAADPMAEPSRENGSRGGVTVGSLTSTTTGATGRSRLGIAQGRIGAKNPPINLDLSAALCARPSGGQRHESGQQVVGGGVRPL